MLCQSFIKKTLLKSFLNLLQNSFFKYNNVNIIKMFLKRFWIIFIINALKYFIDPTF